MPIFFNVTIEILNYKNNKYVEMIFKSHQNQKKKRECIIENEKKWVKILEYLICIRKKHNCERPKRGKIKKKEGTS